MALTPEQKRVLADADDLGRIFEPDKMVCPGIHFCPDWDYMPICDDSPEREACTCTPTPKE